MKKSYFISDTHFGQESILTFRDKKGCLIRPFSNIEEMDELMVENWNKTVKPHDKIYHLGDIAQRRKDLSILNRLNGKKVLIKGNHDLFQLKDYTPYFKDIRAYKVLPDHGIIFSHIPINYNSLIGKINKNVHGHLHQNILEDKRYLNVCVERINYKPIEFDEIVSILDKQQNL